MATKKTTTKKTTAKKPTAKKPKETELKVSVIIPAYNAEDTIEQAIKSIPNREDVEVVVIDDGSTDKTYSVAENALKGRKSQLFHKENGGVASALNVGLDHAKGEYVVLLGSDDDFYTSEFEKAMEQLDGTDLVYFNLKINSGEVWYLGERTKHFMCGSVKFMRREFIGNIRNNESLKAAEDQDFYQRLLDKKPTEVFTGLVVKHYNFPREGSLYDRFKKGEFDAPRQDYLSIIIPAYNSKDTLKRLLDSLTSQRYNSGITAEIIVINDGSTDGTAEMLASYGNSIRAITQENKGVSAARNAGIKVSTGKYISFVDADDSVSDTYIKDVTDSIREDCDYCIFPWADAKTGQVYFDVFNEIPAASVWCYAFKYETIRGQLFREDWQIGEDLEWLKRVLPGKRKKFSDKIVYTYDWNSNPDSLSKQYNRGDIKQERK